MIRFRCPCGKTLTVGDQYAGKQAKCPACGQMLRIPQPAPPPEPLALAPEEPTPQPVAVAPAPDADAPLALAPEPVAPQPAPPAPYSPGLFAPRASSHRHYDYQEDVARGNLVKLAVALFAGFFLPFVLITPMGSTVSFFNIQALFEPVGEMAKFFCLYPALAGAAVLVAAYKLEGVRMALALMVTALLIWVVLLVQPGTLQGIELLSAIPGVAGLGILFLVKVLAFMGMFAGLRALRYRPASAVAATVGAASAGAYLACLLVPVVPGPFGPMGLLTPFKMLGRQVDIVSVLGFVRFATMVAAAAMCIVLWRPERRSPELADLGFKVLIGGICIFIGGLFVEVVRGFLFAGQVGAVIMIVSIFAKFLCWFGGLVLLLPVGLTRLLVELTPEEAEEEPPPAAAGDPLKELKRQLDAGLISEAEYDRRLNELFRR